MDLSWPPGASVNDGIPTDSYLGLDYKMQLPKIDDMANLVGSLPPGSFMFKTDLRRGYKQLVLTRYPGPSRGSKWMIGYI